MNKIYSKVWNKELGQLVVASEFARSDSTGVVQGAGAATLLRRSLLAAVIAPMLALAGLAGSTAFAQDANWTVTDGDNNDAAIGDGGTVAFQGGSNISVAQTGGDDAGTVVISLDDEVDLGADGSLTIGDTLVNSSGLTITAGPSVTNTGIDAGGFVITDVDDGVQSSDAVNLGQLDVVREVASGAQTTAEDAVQAANAAMTAAQDAGAAWVIRDGSSSADIGPGGTVTFEGDGNISVELGGDDNNGVVTVTLDESLTVTSITTGDATLNTNGLTINDGPRVTSAGIDAGSLAITNIADGDLTATSTDAVSGRQIFELFLEQGAGGVRYFRARSAQPDSQALGDESIAIGPSTVAEGDSSFAAGDGATTTATAEGAIALGQGATAGTEGGDVADGEGSIAIGRDSTAAGRSTVALGDGASVESEYVSNATALGAGASVTGNESNGATAVGANAHAGNANATALGSNASASGANGTALGVGAQASGASAVAVGDGAVAAASNNISIGEGAGVGTFGDTARDQTNNIAVGAQAGQRVVGQRNLAMGSSAGSDTAGNDNIAFGEDAGTGLEGDGNISIGRNANEGGGLMNRAIGIGENASAGSDGIAMGHGASAAGVAGVALGVDASTQGDGVGVGAGSVADAGFVALGVGSQANAGRDVTGPSAVTSRAFDGTAVSVGSSAPGNPFTRRIVNVEDGANETDAVNVRQLLKAIEDAEQFGGVIDYDELGDRIGGNFAEQIEENRTKYVSINDGGTQQGNFQNNGAEGARSIAIGPDARTTGENSAAMGSEVLTSGDSSVGVGHDIRAVGDNTTVIGNSRTEARDTSGVAIGTQAVSRGDNSIVIGTRSESDDQDGTNVQNSIVIGTDSQSTAREGIVVGRDSLVNAERGMAQGDNAQATAVDAMAFGTRSRASGTRSQASGTDANASGTNAIATGTDASGRANDGIAIGTGAESGFVVTSPADAPRNRGSIAIGDSSLANDLDALALGVRAQATAEDALAVGSEARATAENASAFGQDARAIAEDALAVGSGARATAQNASAFGRGAQASHEGSVALGSNAVTAEPIRTEYIDDLDGNRYNFAGTDPVATVSVGSRGQERTITNVAAGRISATSTDAINGSQLHGTNMALEALADDLDTAGTSIAAVLGGDAEYDPDTHQVTMTDVGGTGKDTVHEAIEYAAQGWDVSAQGGAAENVAPGGSVDFSNTDDNIEITRAGTDLTFNLADDLEIGSSITFLDGDTVINGDSITTNNLTVEGNTRLGENFTVNEGGVYYDGDIIEGDHIVNKTYVDGAVGELAGTPLTFAGDRGGGVDRLLGETVNLVGGADDESVLTDDNIGVVANGDDTLEIKLNKDINLGEDGSLAIGDAELDTDGLVVTDDDGNATSIGSTQVMVGGNSAIVIDGDAGTIEGLANIDLDGDDFAQAGRAATEEQLSIVNEAANAGWNVLDADGNEANIGPNGELTFVAGDSNLTVELSDDTADAGVMEITLADNIELTEEGSIAIGDGTDGSRLDAGGLAVVDGANETTVGAGLISVTDEGGTTTIGGNEISIGGNSQIVISGETGTIGGLTNTTFDPDNFTRGQAATEDQLKKVSDVASMGWNISAQKDNETNVGPGGSVDLSNTDGNIVVAKTEDDNDVTFDLADVITLGEGDEAVTIDGESGVVSVGDTAIDGGGVSVGDDVHLGDTGLVIGDADGPRFTNDGISAGDQVISNVAPGEVGTDAVNLDQLTDTVETNRTKYYSVNDGGVVGANYDNDGAAGVDSLAAGKDASTTGAYDVAVGTGANTTGAYGGTAVGGGVSGDPDRAPTTAGQFGTAVGFSAQASGTGDTAIGTFASTGDDQADAYRTAIGYRAEATGIVATAIGQFNRATGERSLAAGYEASALADDSVAIGSNAIASHDGAVALGMGSETAEVVGTAGVTLDGTTYQFAGATPESTVSVGSEGNERTITNVAAGRISAESTDAINGSQLHATNQSLGQLGDQAVRYDLNPDGTVDYTTVTLNPGGTGPTTITNVAAGVNDSDAVNVSQLNELANTPLTFAGDAGDDVERRLGETVNLVGGATDEAALTEGNIGVVADGTDTLEIKLNKDIDLGADGSVAIGNTTVNNAGLTVANATGSTTVGAGFVSVEGPGGAVMIDGNTGIIGGLANRTIDYPGFADGSGRAATEEQLDIVNQTANAGWNLTGSGEDEVNIGPDGSVDFQGDRNISVAQTGEDQDGVIQVTLNRDLDVDSVTAGDTIINTTGVAIGTDVHLGNTGLVINGGPSVTVAGINAGNLVITNVAPGEISATSTDAINGSQLHGMGDSIVNVIGGNAELNPDGTIVTSDIGGTGHDNIDDAIRSANDAANAGWTATDADGNAANIGPNGSVNFTGDGNISVAQTGDDNSGEIEITLNRDLDVDSITAGDTVIDTDGVRVGDDVHLGDTGLVIEGGPSVTTDGIDAGGQVISNVAAGVEDTDAANVGQIRQVAADVVDLGDRMDVVEGDVSDLQAGAAGPFQVSQEAPLVPPTPTGENSAAGGSGADASGDNSTALGNQAVASGANSTAVGQGAQATHDNSVALGQGSETTVGAQSGYDAAYVGSSSSSGEVNVGNRTISGVAPGVAGNDAVNVNQLNAGVNHAVVTANEYTDQRFNQVQGDVWHLHGRVDELEKNINSGVATAMAMRQAPYVAGATTYYAGFGAYKDQGALGVSMRRTADNGRWSLEGGFSANRDGTGGYIGVSGVLGSK